MPSQPSQHADLVGSVTPRPQQQQHQQHQQHQPSTYAQVAAWLTSGRTSSSTSTSSNTTTSSTSSSNSAKGHAPLPLPLSKSPVSVQRSPGGPRSLLPWGSTLLWQLGLGGALRSSSSSSSSSSGGVTRSVTRGDGTSLAPTQQQQRPAAAAAGGGGVARPGSGPGSTAASPAASPAAAAAPPTPPAAAPRQVLPRSGQTGQAAAAAEAPAARPTAAAAAVGPVGAGAAGQRGSKGRQLASHPLTPQQLEQSMGFSSSSAAGFSSSSSSSMPSLAPVQAIAKGLKSRSPAYVGPLGAAALKLGDDVCALLASVPRTMRTLQWALQAGWGYKQLLARLEAAHLDPEGAGAAALSRLHDYWAQRLTEVCRANGGIYVKAGQFAAAFGAVPPEYRKHLALLQDKAKPRPFHVVDRVLRLELGAGAEQVFAEFSAEATAAASLAQVHKARLSDGRQVAVKVQYPGLRGAANADLTTLALLSGAAAAAFPQFRLAWLYEELAHKLEEELDFHIELHNAQKLMSCLHSGSNVGGSSCAIGAGPGGSGGGSGSRGSTDVVVPKAHVALCTSKVLTMEWIDGIKINDTAGLRAAQISPRAVGAVVDEAFAEMTFVHGWIHADPHPGNIMVRPRGRRGLASWLARGTWQPFEVVLLDHGTYHAIPDALRRRYCQLWCALFAGDTAGAAAVAIELGGARAGQILPVLLTQRGRTKEEQKQMQRAAGVGSFGDITQLLSTAPRDIVELLRIAAVVRNVTATLGCSLADRLRCSGAWAFRGLPPCGQPGNGLDGPDGQAGGTTAVSEADRRYNQAAYRLNIRARILAIRGYVALNAALHRLLLATLHVFGQPVVMY